MTEAEWLASDDPAAMLSVLLGTGGTIQIEGRDPADLPPSDRKLRLFACACCSRAERGDASEERWELWQQAIAAAERVADGAPISDLAAYGSHCWAAWQASGERAAALSARFMAEAMEDAAGKKAEQAAQAALLREIVGNPFRPVTVSEDDLDNWLLYKASPGTGPAGVGYRIYRDRDFGLMPMLADVLEDAGCPTDEPCPKCGGKGWLEVDEGSRTRWEWCDRCDDNNRVPSALLAHLRGPGPHVRGCWALDLILGKS